MCVFTGSAGPDVCILDQMTVANISDQEAFDDFLNASGDNISTGSSLTSGNSKSFTLKHERHCLLLQYFFHVLKAVSVVFSLLRKTSKR